MKKQLLSLIKELELLRAQAITERDEITVQHVEEATKELYWAYHYITEYE